MVAPVGGIVTQKLADAGELVAPRAPLLVVTDLDHAWANLFVPEPMMPRLTLGQAATVLTDAGGEGLPGKVTFISPRAEFTPRNVQTRRRALEARLPHQGDRGQPRRRAQAGHAGGRGAGAAMSAAIQFDGRRRSDTARPRRSPA